MQALPRRQLQIGNWFLRRNLTSQRKAAKLNGGHGKDGAPDSSSGMRGMPGMRGMRGGPSTCRQLPLPQAAVLFMLLCSCGTPPARGRSFEAAVAGAGPPSSPLKRCCAGPDPKSASPAQCLPLALSVHKHLCSGKEGEVVCSAFELQWNSNCSLGDGVCWPLWAPKPSTPLRLRKHNLTCSTCTTAPHVPKSGDPLIRHDAEDVSATLMASVGEQYLLRQLPTPVCDQQDFPHSRISQQDSPAGEISLGIAPAPPPRGQRTRRAQNSVAHNVTLLYDFAKAFTNLPPANKPYSSVPGNAIIPSPGLLQPSAQLGFGGFNFTTVVSVCDSISSNSIFKATVNYSIAACPIPEQPLHGKMNLTRVGADYSNAAVYACTNGYRLNGSALRRCNATGQWEGEPPTCLVGCSDPHIDYSSDPEHGRVHFRPYGRTAVFSCDQGYLLNGSNATCISISSSGNQTHGEHFQWNSSVPSCFLACEKNLSKPLPGACPARDPETKESLCTPPHVHYTNATANVSCVAGYELKIQSELGGTQHFSYLQYTCDANSRRYRVVQDQAASKALPPANPQCEYACKPCVKSWPSGGYCPKFENGFTKISGADYYAECNSGYAMVLRKCQESADAPGTCTRVLGIFPSIHLSQKRKLAGTCNVEPDTALAGAVTPVPYQFIMAACISTPEVLLLIVLTMLAAFLLLYCMYRRWCRKQKRSGGPGQSLIGVLVPPPSPQFITQLDDDEQGIYNVVLEKEAINFDDVDVLEKVGIGSSAAVFKARYHGTECAVKRLNLMMKGDEEKLFRAEVRMLLRLRHPNVVMFFGVSFAHDDCYLVTEYCPRGSLYSYLQDKSNPMPFQLQLQMAVDTARGMNFLHKSNIIHRDIKSGNLLVTEHLQVKICDFGISRHVNAQNTMTTSLGTVPWTAPEMLRGERYSKKVDCYSFGVCLWELVTRRVPYDGVQSVRIITSVINGMRPQIPEDCPALFYDLISECWQHKPATRPGSTAIVERLEAALQGGSSMRAGDLSRHPPRQGQIQESGPRSLDSAPRGAPYSLP